MRAVPARRFERELLDGPVEDEQELQANLRDMVWANRLLLSNRAILRSLRRWLDSLPAGSEITVLDVATGAGALPRAIAQWSRAQGYRTRLIASDIGQAVVAIARENLAAWDTAMVRHDALRIPLPDRSVEVVTCAFALHHFAPGPAIALLRELARVARLGVLVSDLRRSYAGYWAASLLAFGSRNRLSRHDGPLSVLRAYTPGEARALVAAAGLHGTVNAEPLLRLGLSLDTTRVRA